MTLYFCDVYFFLFGFLLGPCILAGYLCIHIWDAQTFDCVYGIHGLYSWIVFVVCVCGLCLWIVWVWIVFGLYGYVFVDCMGICMDIGS